MILMLGGQRRQPGALLMQHFHLLLDQLYAEIGHASDVTTRPAEAGDKSSRDRVYRR
jgi:hypothetical protein